MLKILVLAFDVFNPLVINWIHGFQSLGYSVTVLLTKQPLPDRQRLQKLGFYNRDFLDVPIFGLWEMVSEEFRKAVFNSLGGTPDLLFCWEGVGILKHVPIAHSYFSTAKIVYDICTHPNCSNILAEWRYILLYRKIDPIVSGYVFYSQTQRKLFNRNVPSSSNKPSAVMIEPFLEKAFSSGRLDSDVPQLERYDENPHIIFTGNATKLWTKSIRHSRKDALGAFLKRLSQHDIHVFVKEKTDTKGLSNLHLFPTFYNPDLISGKFSQYISQFDSHLVIYNEFNQTSRRRVASGLATRFAYAITSTCPIAVTHASKFIEEYPQDTPFWFTFLSVENLIESLHNKKLLKSLRHNMEKVHKSYTFESQSQRITHFFEEILEQPKVIN